jgi:hypothetical protein
MAALVPIRPILPPPIAWTLPAAIQLIRERRVLNNHFVQQHGNRNHENAWHAVANNLFIATGFVATAAQCRNKWNALKRGIILFLILFLKNFSFILTIKSQLLFFLKGYENLQRIITNNPDGFPLASPNNFDHACFIEMSDHFWGPRSNYFIYFNHFLFRQFTHVIYLYFSLFQTLISTAEC